MYDFSFYYWDECTFQKTGLAIIIEIEILMLELVVSNEYACNLEMSFSAFSFIEYGCPLHLSRDILREQKSFCL